VAPESHVQNHSNLPALRGSDPTRSYQSAGLVHHLKTLHPIIDATSAAWSRMQLAATATRVCPARSAFLAADEQLRHDARGRTDTSWHESDVRKGIPSCGGCPVHV